MYQGGKRGNFSTLAVEFFVAEWSGFSFFSPFLLPLSRVRSYFIQTFGDFFFVQSKVLHLYCIKDSASVGVHSCACVCARVRVYVCVCTCMCVRVCLRYECVYVSGVLSSHSTSSARAVLSIVQLFLPFSPNHKHMNNSLSSSSNYKKNRFKGVLPPHRRPDRLPTPHRRTGP